MKTNRHSQQGGYLLLEVILALTIFSIAVMGLMQSLNVAISSSSSLNRENDIRVGVRSFLEEIRRKPLADMATTYEDPRLGVTYTSTVEELELRDRNGTRLRNLYTLHVAVTYGEGNDKREETADVYVYKPPDVAK
jgi:Tfp pilus assembly protein PilV